MTCSNDPRPRLSPRPQSALFSLGGAVLGVALLPGCPGGTSEIDAGADTLITPMPLPDGGHDAPEDAGSLDAGTDAPPISPMPPPLDAGTDAPPIPPMPPPFDAGMPIPPMPPPMPAPK